MTRPNKHAARFGLRSPAVRIRRMAAFLLHKAWVCEQKRLIRQDMGYGA